MKKINKKDLETVQKETVTKENNSSRRKGFVKSFNEFVEETKSELSKVTWLDRKKLFAYFVIVLIITFAITFFVSAIDVVISETFKLLKSTI